MPDVVPIAVLVAEFSFIDEHERTVVSKVYRTRHERYVIHHRTDIGVDAEGRPAFDAWFEPISLFELVDGWPSEELIVHDPTLLFRVPDQPVAEVGRLTPSEIASMRQQIKEAHRRFAELRAPESRENVAGDL